MRILLRFLQNHLPKISILVLVLFTHLVLPMVITIMLDMLPLFYFFQLLFEDLFQVSLYNFLVKIVFDHPTFFSV